MSIFKNIWPNGLGVSKVLSLGFLLILVVAALGGSFLRPDKSPLANTQQRTIGGLPPLSKVEFLRVRMNNQTPETPWYSRFFLGGITSQFDYIPIDNFEFQKNRIKVRVRSVADIEEYRFYSYLDLLYPVNAETIRHFAQFNGNLFTFDDAFGQQQELSMDGLEKRIKQKSIVSRRFLFGTDHFGRDLLSRIMAGGFVSLTIGFISVLISLIIGSTIGLIAGYFGGRVDQFFSWVINVFWSVPSILLVIAINMVFGYGLTGLLIGISLILWVEMAQLVRGEVKMLREKEFIKAAQLMGLSNWRILYYHILPNISGSIIVLCSSNFAEAILLESGLSFLGIGIQAPMPSWGNMIRESYGYIVTQGAYMPIIPGITIVLTVLAFSTIGNQLVSNKNQRRVLTSASS
jgi:peptide/nickel transport system permease protein